MSFTGTRGSHHQRVLAVLLDDHVGCAPTCACRGFRSDDQSVS